jgi:hypothetical protein
MNQETNVIYRDFFEFYSLEELGLINEANRTEEELADTLREYVALALGEAHYTTKIDRLVYKYAEMIFSRVNWSEIAKEVIKTETITQGV